MKSVLRDNESGYMFEYSAHGSKSVTMEQLESMVRNLTQPHLCWAKRGNKYILLSQLLDVSMSFYVAKDKVHLRFVIENYITSEKSEILLRAFGIKNISHIVSEDFINSYFSDYLDRYLIQSALEVKEALASIEE